MKDKWWAFLILLALDLYFLWAAAKNCKRRRLIRDTPITPIAQLRAGLAAVRGKAVAAAQALLSPLSQTPCVYYQFKLEEKRTSHTHSSTGKSSSRSTWHTIVNDRSCADCAVTDSTGAIPVDLTRAEIELDPSVKGSTGLFSSAPPEVEAMLKERYGASTKGLVFNRPMRYTEAVLPADKDVYAIGSVQDAAGGKLILTKGPHPLLISDRDAASLQSRFTRRIWGQSALVAVLTAAFIAGLVYALK